MWNMFWYTSFYPQNSKSFKPFQQKNMFFSCFNIMLVPCFNHVSALYQFHVFVMFHHYISSMFQSYFNIILVPCFNILLVPKKHVTILVGKFMFRWQIIEFLNNYHVLKHVYRNFILHSWMRSWFDFQSWHP
jgi:hypothetical protein